MANTYSTLAPDIVEHADLFHAYLKSHGFKVEIEPGDPSFPFPPTLLGKMAGGHWYVEVSNVCNLARLRTWIAYSKTRQKETKVCLLLPQQSTLSGDIMRTLRELGIGLFISDGTKIDELLRPKDISLPSSLPDIALEKAKLRIMLTPIYRKFDAGDPIDGFKDACQLLEDLARSRFVADFTSQRIKMDPNGTNAKLKVERVKKMTLGQLAIAYSEIVAPNLLDSNLAKALAAINGDRVDAVHHTNNVKLINKVKKNCSKHMWTIVNALRQLI